MEIQVENGKLFEVSFLEVEIVLTIYSCLSHLFCKYDILISHFKNVMCSKHQDGDIHATFYQLKIAQIAQIYTFYITSKTVQLH